MSKNTPALSGDHLYISPHHQLARETETEIIKKTRKTDGSHPPLQYRLAEGIIKLSRQL